MNRILSIAIVLLMALSAGAADRYARDPEPNSIATTGRIVKIDAKNKTLKVRSSDGQSLSIRSIPQGIAQMMQGLTQRIPITLPGGITIPLPGRKPPSKPSPDPAANPDEFTVVTTKDTVFQDGTETLRFEDFRTGETISIHGVLSGNTLSASRIAKWF